MEVDTSLPATGSKRPSIYLADSYSHDSSDERESIDGSRANKKRRAGLSPTFATLSLSPEDKSPQPSAIRKHHLQDADDDVPMDDEEYTLINSGDTNDNVNIVNNKSKPAPGRRILTPPRKRRPGSADFSEQHTVYIASIDDELADDEEEVTAGAGPSIEVLDPSLRKAVKKFGKSEDSQILFPFLKSLDPPQHPVTERGLILYRPMQSLIPAKENTTTNAIGDTVQPKENETNKNAIEDEMIVDS